MPFGGEREGQRLAKEAIHSGFIGQERFDFRDSAVVETADGGEVFVEYCELAGSGVVQTQGHTVAADENVFEGEVDAVGRNETGAVHDGIDTLDPTRDQVVTRQRPRDLWCANGTEAPPVPGGQCRVEFVGKVVADVVAHWPRSIHDSSTRYEQYIVRLESYSGGVTTPEREPPTRERLRIEDVIAALDHPVRLQVVRTLAALAHDATMTCQEILPTMTKSSASHHWRVLRESGVIEQRRDGRVLRTRLRRADLDGRFPGVVAAVLGE
jgi:DNA-binding transcriptional ArsR family regulator